MNRRQIDGRRPCRTRSHIDGTLLARTVDWPEPNHALPLAPDTKVTAKVKYGKTKIRDERSRAYSNRAAETDWEDVVVLSASYPVESVWLESVPVAADEASGDRNIDDGRPLCAGAVIYQSLD